MRKAIRCSSIALIGVMLILAGVQTALAHTDPPGATATGVGISLTAFRADGTTTILGGSGEVTECETINYQATLSWLGGNNAAFQGGTWSITTPDGVSHDVTPVGGIPCIGGTVAPCDPTVDFIVSALVPYTVNEADLGGACAAGAEIVASTSYINGTAHIGINDTPGVNAGTPFTLPVTCCGDDLACNGTDVCDPTATFTDPNNQVRLGECQIGDPVVCPDDNNLCTLPLVCTEPGGLCVPSGPDVTCDDLFCAPEACNPATGLCEPTGQEQDCDDQNACTTDTCNEETDVCDHVDNVTPTCDANCEVCDTTTGTCVDQDPLPAECVPSEEICRTPGFWGTHAGDEKDDKSQDITGALLAAFNATNDLTVCGVAIEDSADAMQAICSSPKGNSQIQLARQLTAAALNCIISTVPGETEGVCDPFPVTTNPCAGTSIEALFDACNAICDGDGDVTTTVDLGAGDVEVNCIALLDCFNNGLGIDPATGECTGEPTGCHERDLETACVDLSFVPPGAAGSPKACAAARKDCFTIFGPIPNCTP